MEFARRDEGDGGAVREKGVQSAAAGGDGLAEGERIVWRGVHKMARGVKPVVVEDSGR